jgi:hypothetical protein
MVELNMTLTFLCWLFASLQFKKFSVIISLNDIIQKFFLNAITQIFTLIIMSPRSDKVSSFLLFFCSLFFYCLCIFRRLVFELFLLYCPFF